MTAIEFNLTLAVENLGGDQELLQELAKMYLEDIPDLTRKLDEAIDGHDYGTAERMVHTIKSMSAGFYAEPLVSRAQKLETTLRETPAEQMAAQQSELRQAVDALKELAEKTCRRITELFSL